MALNANLPGRPSGALVHVGTLDSFERSARERDCFERGRAQGETQALSGAASALSAAAERFDTARAQALDAVAASAVELALEIARELLRVEIARGAYDIEAIVRDTLRAAEVEGACVVHLHPDDAGALERAHLRTGTELRADPDVRRGDVRVATPQGLLVRAMDACLREIGEELRGDLA